MAGIASKAPSEFAVLGVVPVVIERRDDVGVKFHPEDVAVRVPAAVGEGDTVERVPGAKKCRPKRAMPSSVPVDMSDTPDSGRERRRLVFVVGAVTAGAEVRDGAGREASFTAVGCCPLPLLAFALGPRFNALIVLFDEEASKSVSWVTQK